MVFRFSLDLCGFLCWLVKFWINVVVMFMVLDSGSFNVGTSLDNSAEQV
jgi:hypothetical protein